MADTGIINIHGKDYKTVAARVKEAHAAKAFFSLDTEVLSHTPIVVRATVTIKESHESPARIYTGISAVNPETARQIEKQSPYEVAETSAVGRALGFAGYGVIDSIASADEIIKASDRPLNVREMGDKAEAASQSAPVTNPAPSDTTDAYSSMTIGQLKLQLSRMIDRGETAVLHEQVGALSREEVIEALQGKFVPGTKLSPTEVMCEVCGEPATEKRGTTKAGKAWHGIFCPSGDKSHTRWLI